MLKDDLKTLLGSTVALYYKAHAFHFNVEGPDFPQYHAFLGEYYEDVYGSVDKIGEYIRTLDSYTPSTLSRLLELSIIKEQPLIPRAELMIAELYQDNAVMLELLNRIFACCETENEQGIANFIAERIDAHGKHGWMLRSILKKQRA
jgi:starvation-inducible DNA-binding protein